jgi:methylated-DNA-[protein]-cysteine S-methyltransferase
MQITEFQNNVYQACKKIPKGRVSTYAEIASVIRNPASVRAVGNALNKNPFAPEVPCHRVVKSGGMIGGFASGSRKKIEILKKEGVMIEKLKIKNFDKVFINIKQGGR